MVQNFSYGSASFLRIVNIQYDNVTHQVTGGSYDPSSTPIPSGLAAGSEFERQVIGTDYWSIRVQNTYPYAYVVQGSTAIPCDLSIDSVDIVSSFTGNPGQITVNASGTGTLRYSLNILGVNPQAGNVFNNVAGQYLLTVSRTEDTCSVSRIVNVPVIADLSINVTPSNVTAPGAADGKLVVDFLSGSQDYHVKFYQDGALILEADLPYIQFTYTPLATGQWKVEVTDNVTGQVVQTTVLISAPVVVPPIGGGVGTPVQYIGTFLKVPFMNSITFVDRGLDKTEQGLDNMLFCEKSFGRYVGKKYFQKYNLYDRPRTQFLSNYESHTIYMYDMSGTFVKSFPIELKQDNLNKLIQFGITITEHLAGQSRVYFASKALPIPMVTGTAFNISDNPDGLDGDYEIISIQIDEAGFQYLVINLDFSVVAGDESIAVGNFKNAFQYNVYESEHIFAELPAGKYYMVLTGTVNSNTRVWQSEPIHLKPKHDNCNKIVYSNVDNAYGVSWTTGYKGLLRVPSFFGHKPIPGGERTLSRNSDYSLVKVDSKKQRLHIFELFGIAGYDIEKLSVIFDLDTFSINDVFCQSSDGLDRPNYVDYSLRPNVEVIVEQLNWFDTYNSDDIMGASTNSSLFLPDYIDLIPVGTTNPTVTLNMADKRLRVFKLTPDITDDRTIALVNQSIAIGFKMVFNILAGIVLTFPNTFVCSNVPDWDIDNKQWTAPDDGKYVAEVVWDGANWNVSFSRTFN